MKKKRKKSMRNPNGFGGIVFLGERRRRPYGVRISDGYNYETGSGKYKYLGYYTTKLEAMKALVDYNIRPYNADDRNRTFEEVYALASVKVFKNASPQKIASYAAAFKACSKIHKKKLSQLRTAELQAVIDEAEARSKSSLNNIKIVFHAVYKYALQNDFAEKDYSQYVDIDDVSASKDKSIFTDKEIDLLWENKDNIYVCIALILIYTGFRINELLTVRLEAVNLQDGYIKHGLKTKNGKGRVVPIHHRIMPIAERFYCEAEESGFLISRDGKALKYSKVKKEYISKLEEIGIASHTLHECRHTTASLLTRYGAKDVYIKKILGHSANDLTKDVYTHAELEDLKKAIELIP
ncbi:MAG: tyrosine-type recombinase/integrase [Clostridiales bacterium]|nr:tyrosine-type recombinase/integrase [Clostridiales bacterium]